MADLSPRRRAAILIAAAALAGIGAGAIAVYVMQSGNGNVAVASTDAVNCDNAVAAGERAAPFAKGDVAAFHVDPRPDRLGGLTFAGPDGKQTTLADLGGKTTLVNLWATWCVPCRTEMPALDRLQADIGGDRFQVVPINIDLNNPKRARAFFDDVGVESLTFYSDPSTAVFRDLKKRGLVLGLPTTFLVDGNGCRIGAVQGPAEWDSDDAKALITAAIGS